MFHEPQSRRVAASGDRVNQGRTSFVDSRQRRPHSLHLFGRLPFFSVAIILAAFLTIGSISLEVRGDEPNSSDSQAFERTLQPYLDKYCISCHGPEKQKGDRRWDNLVWPISDTTSLLHVQEILDIINLGEMPPIEEDVQPSAAENKAVVDLLTLEIEARYATLESTDQQTVFRRLNRREYRNTIRDLLNMEMSSFDPTESFPTDETIHHLDTIGDRLVTSGYLLDRYLEAADEIIEKAFADLERPPTQTYRFTDNFQQQPELDRALKDWGNYEFIALYETPLSQRHEGAYAKIHGFEGGVPHDGYYRIRAKAIAKNRVHDHPERRVSTNIHEPIQLGIVPGNQVYGDLSRPQPIETELARFELKDDVLEWKEATVWLDKGITPRFTYPNGMVGLRGNFKPIADALAADPNSGLKNVDFSDRRLIAMQHGKLPHIQIHDVEIIGPIYESWPPPQQRVLLGEKPYSSDRNRQLITSFASKAFRRPAEAQEVDRLMAFVDKRRADGASNFQAYKDTLKRILCSPSFLYLDEPEQDDGSLSQHALASRLSYLFWSSMPDDKLSSLARKGRLNDERTLKQEIRRMLGDPKAKAFFENVVDSCFTLKDLGTQPPDRRAFPLYYSRNLKPHMRQETLLFTRHLLEENLSITNFVEADFSFVNGPLAELYGYKNVAGSEFRKIRATDANRAGILGHASILTVSANGIDTSPVTRGVWILENLLGSPPSPPPPDVEPFDPDTRGATSIRDQLEKHRENQTCYDCHRKIDPMGFAFESFDAIGQWRDQYSKDLAVDASGTLPDGTRYTNIIEFRKAMLRRTPQISRSLVSKLLELGTGRRMEIGDRPAIDDIVEELESRGNGFYDLVELVATSDTFGRP